MPRLLSCGWPEELNFKHKKTRAIQLPDKHSDPLIKTNSSRPNIIGKFLETTAQGEGVPAQRRGEGGVEFNDYDSNAEGERDEFAPQIHEKNFSLFSSI